VFPTVSLDIDGLPPDFVVEGERKLVTVLFADIKGSVELMEDLDPEDARAILDPALMLMVDAIHSYEGYVVQTTGDGIHALFGAPATYQDHPRRAVHAGLAMQTTLNSYAAQLATRDKPVIQVRVGINTGEAVVRALNTGGRLEYGGVGHTVNLAARLQASAPLGSIALGELTARLVEGYFDLRALPPMSLKGVRGAVTAHEVIGVGPLSRHIQLALRRGPSKFVGRDAEMTLLQGSLTQATGGNGQIVATVTDAGTGKSRLLYEFLCTVPTSYRVLEAYAMSHGKGMPWMPVIDLLKKYFDLRADDDPSAQRTKVEKALTLLGPDFSDRAPYLFGLLGIVAGTDLLPQMDPQVRRARTIAAITQILQAESRRVPLILVFEDLHWADGQTLLLLDAIADSIGEARILLLVTCRPEFSPLWRGRDGYTEIRLEPLTADCAVELLDSLLPDTENLAALNTPLLTRLEAIPFSSRRSSIRCSRTARSPATAHSA
jgi:class 3 adenylate cyclase